MPQSEPIADMVTQMQEPTSGQFIKENEAKTSDVTALVEKEAKIAMQELTRGAEADTFVPGSIHRPVLRTRTPSWRMGHGNAQTWVRHSD